MSVRFANSNDLASIAGIHKAQFPTHFLGQYSVSLLAEFYRCFLGHTVFLVHDTENGVNGFVLGGAANQLSACKATFVRHNLMRCACETLLRPSLWVSGVHRGLLTLAAPRTSRRQHSESTARLNFSLLSIAVRKEAVGKGIATQLVDAFEKQLVGSATEYRLSVNKDNPRALAFYKKAGFEVMRDSGDSLEFHRVIISPPA